MQSSQRRTSEETRPSISLVFTPSAPASYARLSRAKNRLIVRFPAPRMVSFIRERKASKSSRVLGMEGRWLEGRKVGRSERRRDGKSRVRKRRPLSRSAVLIPYLPLSDFPTFRPSDYSTISL